jgi:hypothetical protein
MIRHRKRLIIEYDEKFAARERGAVSQNGLIPSDGELYGEETGKQ